MVLEKLTPTQKEMFKYLTIGLLYSYEEIAEYIGMNKTNINKQCKTLIENGYMVKLNSRPVKVRLIKSFDFELTNITNKGTKTKVKNDTSGLLDQNKITPDTKKEKLKCPHGIELGKRCYLCDVKQVRTEKILESIKTSFNPSIELNLIKSLYANRFGTSTDMLKDKMINKMIKTWRAK